MFVLAIIIAVVVTWVVVRWRRRRANADLAGRPLAGLDTGTRSPYRTPGGRFLGPRRGF